MMQRPETTAKAINEAVAAGVKAATFASSDIDDCDRAFFVGNTDNYGDGCALAKAVCERVSGYLLYKTKAALLFSKKPSI